MSKRLAFGIAAAAAAVASTAVVFLKATSSQPSGSVAKAVPDAVNASSPSTQPSGDAAKEAEATIISHASPVARPTPTKLSLETELLDDLKSGDPAKQARAIHDIKYIARAEQTKIVADIGAWLEPLFKAQQFETLIALTDQAIVPKASNAVLLSDIYIYRIRSHSALGSSVNAMPEVRALFNICTNRLTPRAIALIYDVQTASEGADSAEAFKRFVTAFPPTPSIEVPLPKADQSAFRESIDALREGKTYDEQMGRANLLLLAGRLDESSETLQKAAKSPDAKGKKLFAVYETLLKIERARTGNVLSMNRAIAAMKAGAIRSRELAALTSTVDLEAGSLREAGRNIAPASLPQDWPTDAKAIADIDLTGQFDATAKLARTASSPDESIAALAESLPSNGKATPERIAEWDAALIQTPLEAGALFPIAATIFEATGDGEVSTHILAEVAKRLDGEMATANPARRLELVDLIEKNRDDFVSILWTRARAGHEPDFARDRLALNTVNKLYLLFVDNAPQGDARYNRLRMRALSSVAGVYYNLADHDKALETFDRIDQELLNDGERLANGWRKALILHRRGDHKNAMPLFRDVARWPGFKERTSAQWFVVICLAHLGEQAAMEQELASFGKEFSKDTEAVRHLTEEAHKIIAEK